MQKLFLYILPLVFLGYCSRPPVAVKTETEGDNSTQYAVSGRVEIRSSYCGGARPSQEMLDEYAIPKPAKDFVLVIRSGEVNDFGVPIAKTVTTDEEGHYSTELPAGTYCLALVEKAQQPDYSKLDSKTYQVNEPCSKEWLNKCELTFQVEEGPVTGLHLLLRKRCFQANFNPCIAYNGPLPP